MTSLKLGDCLELMKDIHTGSVDMVLCDLPYGTTQNKWDSVINLQELWDSYTRIIKEHGAIVLFSQQPFSSKLICSNPKMFRYEWIWEKDFGTGFLNARKMPLKKHESILVFYKKLPCYNAQGLIYRPHIKNRGKNLVQITAYSQMKTLQSMKIILLILSSSITIRQNITRHRSLLRC